MYHFQTFDATKNAKNENQNNFKAAIIIYY